MMNIQGRPDWTKGYNIGAYAFMPKQAGLSHSLH